jgi:hypothetical protein
VIFGSHMNVGSLEPKFGVSLDRDGIDRLIQETRSPDDVPFHHPAVEILKVRVSRLPLDAAERVLCKNGRLLLFGDEDAIEPVVA